MNRIKLFIMAIFFSIAVFNHQQAYAQSASDIEYDVYEMAESGMLIKFPKKQERKSPENVIENKKTFSDNSGKKDIEMEYDVYEMAESGMLIKFPKKTDSYVQKDKVENRNSNLHKPKKETVELEYDVYELAESGMLIKFPKKKIATRYDFVTIYTR